MASSDRVLKMASTTSTDNTGLLAYIASIFEKETGISLQWLATGTGRALELGRHCDVDVLLVHAPKAEKEFIDSGFGLDRREVMHNDFILVGPKKDPAGIKGLNATEGLKRIAETGSPFISRGDDSGTHKREQALWKASGIIPPSGADWYDEADKGMRDTLERAAEQKAYVLADRGTFITYMSGTAPGADLAVLIEGGEALKNQYGVIAVNPAKCKHARLDLAEQFIAWLTSDKGQTAIAEFRLQGQQLFIPNAGR
ncbi:MAG: substrate-binding domain-containing protein [Humidesulfovibrio sp.]